MFAFWAGVWSVHVLNDGPTGTCVSGRSVIGRVIVFFYAHVSSSLGLVHPFGTVHDCSFYICLPNCPKAKFPRQVTLHRAVMTHNV